MKVEVGIWPKLSRVFLFLMLIAALVGVGLWYLPLIQQNKRMREVNLRLMEEVAEEERRQEELKTRIEALKTDSNAIARAAREILGYARPDEVVIQFEKPEADSTAP